jgi:mono/diheme cytochrome c family protein
MKRDFWRTAFLTFLALPLLARGAEPSAAERGETALLTRHFTPPTFSLSAYQDVWKLWDNAPKTKPADYDAAFRTYYGMHAAPYPNHGYPMGFREAPGFFGRKALASDCMLCHAGSIFGKSYVGLPNTALDMESLYADLAGADGLPRRTPFTFTNVRGTTEAGAMAVYLLEMRDPDLKLRSPRLNFRLRHDLCEDPPAWWLLHKKQTMYHTGGADARSVRSIMQFMMSPLNPASAFPKNEAAFADIQQYILSLRPPKYPLPIDRGLAEQGEKLFVKACARCHGTYGANWTYPNKVIPLEEIGTDPTRFHGISQEFGRYYNESWFAKEKTGWLADGYAARQTKGYQAPPLDGIWATAPYFHNGSVPTVADVLNSKSRPKIFTRSYRTDQESYDPVKLGWKVEVLERGADPKLSAYERRKVYDTTQTGRGNGGHTFGDHFTDAERRAVIEYLKTL